jgi:hypothetical protein
VKICEKERGSLLLISILKQTTIKDILNHNPSYTVDEFLFLCQDLQLRNRSGMHPD